MVKPVTKTVVYKSVPVCDIRADVHWMPGPTRQPAILWLHGGALIFGSRAGIPAYQLGAFLRAGYTVISADYRLAPQVKLEAIIEDLRDAYAWTRSDGPRLFSIDPERIAVMGQSAGAYLTLVTGYAVTPRPRALVSFYGYGDLTGAWYSQPSPYYCDHPAVARDDAYRAVGHDVLSEGRHEDRSPFYLYCRQHGLWPLEVTGHDPQEEADWFAHFCPVRNVTGDYPPTLLIHGDVDTDVPYELSVMMDAELERRQAAHEFLTLHGRGHAFDHAADAEHDPVIRQTLDKVLVFLSQHV